LRVITDITYYSVVTIFTYICYEMHSLEQYQFLRVQVKMKNPDWTDEEINAEMEKIISGYYDDDSEDCLYCGS
jgi:hypothetical protein